jgi:hypothetical protein
MNRGNLLGLGILLMPLGCLSAPPTDNPLIVRPPEGTFENPVLVSPRQTTPAAYAEVFEKVIDVFDDYFPIAYSNRYDGRVIGAPTIAPGFERIWQHGSTDCYERLLATFQTMRYRGMVQIRAAEQGGYLVQVTVYRELKDDPRPILLETGSVFRDNPTVDRQFEVVDPEISSDPVWIPKGRATDVEEAILRKIRACQFQ